MSKSLILSVVLCGAALLGGSSVWAADVAPSDVYAAAKAGHIAQAEQMVDEAVKEHPGSAKAHYVAAEIYAKAGNFSRARSELDTARGIEPALSFESPASVSALEREVSASHGVVAQPGAARQFEPPERSHGLPWGTIIIVALVIGLLWTYLRRRAAMSSYAYPGSVPPGGGQPGYGGGPMGGPMGGGPYYPGGGGGSGLMGSLGTGLAVGAGVVAGEELVRHVLDHNDSGGVISNAGAGERDYTPPENANMGGDNFGLNDASSWDDSGAGDSSSFDSGGGGDDWT
jgi:uncharacterized protein